MKWLGSVLVLAAVLLAGRAEAESEGIAMRSCYDLLNACRTLNQLVAGKPSAGDADDNWQRAVNCAGYVAGFMDAAMQLGGKDVCLPGAMQRGQQTNLVERWIESHPAKQHLPPATCVLAALRESFPCKD
jgi:hypothetical protein